MKKQYDYLLVGSGLFAGVFAYYAKKAGKTCLVLEKRGHAGGNIYCENIEGINVHRYGAHIFHTSNKEVWNFVNSLVEFNRYTNSPVANYKGEMYNMPFNMNTFSRMWGISTPEEAKKIINEQRKVIKGEPKNLEEQAISLVGTHIYQKLVKGYTEKQWGRDCKELPAFIIKRLGTDYLADKAKYDALADKVVYTGTIDSYFDYCFGKLQYRSLRFETEVLDCDNYQGNAVINYTDRETPYTRIIEHKHFEFGTQEKTVITREYPAEWTEGMEPYYPVNDEKNQELYKKYAELAGKEENVIFGGRLAEYRYYDMDKVIESAFSCVKKEFGNE